MQMQGQLENVSIFRSSAGIGLGRNGDGAGGEKGTVPGHLVLAGHPSPPPVFPFDSQDGWYRANRGENTAAASDVVLASLPAHVFLVGRVLWCGYCSTCRAGRGGAQTPAAPIASSLPIPVTSKSLDSGFAASCITYGGRGVSASRHGTLRKAGGGALLPSRAASSLSPRSFSTRRLAPSMASSNKKGAQRAKPVEARGGISRL